MIPEHKVRVTITLDRDVFSRAREYATRISLSSMINRMLSEALGFQPPRELTARLPKEEGEEEEE